MIEGHTHHFSELLRNDETGIEHRCQCGARLWEPREPPVLRFSTGGIYKRNGRLVFERDKVS